MENNLNKISIGNKAPRFCANSTYGPIKLTDYMGKWLVLFSYPTDFTPVPTTELMTFSKYEDEFKKRNSEILALNIDSAPSHIAWLKDIEKNSRMKIDIPIISDRDKKISRKYSCLDDDEEKNNCTVYIIDPEQVVRCILVYPESNGRNISEILRIIDSLNATNDKSLTPANWLPGYPTLDNSPTNYIDLMESVRSTNELHRY